MMQKEWEELVKHDVTPDEYRIVEQVYMYHPLVLGKADMLKIYKLGGMGLIESMLPDADKAMIFEQDIQHHHDGRESTKVKIAELERVAELCTKNALAKVAEYRTWKARFKHMSEDCYGDESGG